MAVLTKEYHKKEKKEKKSKDKEDKGIRDDDTEASSGSKKDKKEKKEKKDKKKRREGEGEGEAADAGAAAAAAEDGDAGEVDGRTDAEIREEMDRLLDEGLYQALRTSLKSDKEFPVSSSVLYTSYIIPSRPPNTTINIKQSSYKKLSQYIKAKKQDKLLLVKAGSGGEESITGVNREHEKLKYYDVREETADSGRAAAGAAGGIEPLTFEVTLRPADRAPLRALLEEVLTADGDVAEGGAGAGGEALDVRKVRFTPELALRAAWAYIAKHGLCPQPADPEAAPAFEPHLLTKKQSRMAIRLDATLCDCLFKGVIKKGETWPTECTLAQAYELFLKQFLPSTTISRGGKRLVKNSEFNVHGGAGGAANAANCVHISEEMKRGFKVTRVSRFETFIIDATELANLLSKKFASSCAVTELEGKANKDMHELTVQGWRADETAEVLKATFGVPPGCIKPSRHKKNNA